MASEAMELYSRDQGLSEGGKPDRLFCEHCQELVSKSTFYRHQILYCSGSSYRGDSKINSDSEIDSEPGSGFDECSLSGRLDEGCIDEGGSVETELLEVDDVARAATPENEVDGRLSPLQSVGKG